MLAFYQSTLYRRATAPPAGYSNPMPTSYGGPQIITTGGTYTFNAESTDVNVDAVSIQTTAPVKLLNCNIKNTGWGVRSTVQGANVTIENTRFYGGALSTKQRRAVIVEYPKNLVVKNCYFENSAGIITAWDYLGDGTVNERIHISNCQVKNIDSRVTGGRIRSQFFQANNLKKATFTTVNGVNYYDGVPNVLIEWVEVINQPGLSDVEDNLNFLATRGTSASPIIVRDVFVKGAYEWDWQGDTYTGSGMIVESPDADKGNCADNITFERCTVIGSNAATFGVAGGTNIKFIDCVGLNKGYLDEADAVRLGLTPASAACEMRGYPASIYVHSNYVAGVTAGIVETNFKEGVVGEKNFSVGPLGWRNDGTPWPAEFGTITNRTTLAGPITEAMEQAEYTAFNTRKNNAGVVLGVIV